MKTFFWSRRTVPRVFSQQSEKATRKAILEKKMFSIRRFFWAPTLQFRQPGLKQFAQNLKKFRSECENHNKEVHKFQKVPYFSQLSSRPLKTFSENPVENFVFTNSENFWVKVQE